MINTETTVQEADMEKQKKEYIIVHTVRYMCALTLFVGISFFSKRVLYFVARQMSADVQVYVIHIFHIILSLLAYHSFFRAFMLTDAVARTKYYTFKITKMRFLTGSWDVKISGLATGVYFLLFANAFAVGSLQEWLEIPRIAAFGIAAVAFFIAFLLTWLEALKEWNKTEEKLQKEKRTRKEIRLLIKHCIGACLAYPILAYLLPIFFPTLRTLPAVIFTFALVVVPIVVVLLAAVFSLDYIRAFWIRFRFFRKLKKAARIHNYKLSEIKYPYSSLFVDHDTSNFTVKANGKTYNCKLLCGVHYGYPMHFEEDGKGVIIRHISLRFRIFAGAPFAKGGYLWQKLPADLMQLRTYFKYSFAGEGTKVLIVCPTPHSIYATAYDNMRPLDVNDKIYGYTLMTGSAFINALERDAVC